MFVTKEINSLYRFSGGGGWSEAEVAGGCRRRLFCYNGYFHETPSTLCGGTCPTSEGGIL